MQSSETTLAGLKDTYLKLFPDLAADDRIRLKAANTTREVTSLFYAGLDRGIRVRFKVRTVFKHEDDDADAGKPANTDDEPEFLEVTTPFGDCGSDFQPGETYLVYATDDDENSGTFSTGSCTRTRRLSDAGEDLADLFFYKEKREESARLEGFATTDQGFLANFDALHNPQTIPAPVGDLVIELQSKGLTRYAQSDGNGHFLFDGLREGAYNLSAFAKGYPGNPEVLAGPQPFHIDSGGCGVQVLLLPGKVF